MSRSVLLALSCAICVVVGCVSTIHRVWDDAADPATIPTCLAFSPDGTTLAVGFRTKHRVRLLDSGTLSIKGEFATEVGVSSIVFSPEGDQLFIRGWHSEKEGAETTERRKAVWYDTRGTKLGSADLGGTSDSVAVSADHRALCHAPYLSSDARGHVRPLFPHGQPVVKSFPIGCYPPRLALASLHGPIAVRETPKLLIWPTPNDEPFDLKEFVDELKVSADGKRLAAAHSSKDGHPVEIIVWDVATRRVERRLQGPMTPLSEFALSADGRFLAAGEGTDLIVWDLNRGKEVLSPWGLASDTPVAFSPDARIAVVERHGAVRIIDLPK